jgi:NADPH:quinone reductase
VRVNRLLLNNIDVVGVGWGHYALDRPGWLARQWADLVPHLRSGAVSPVIGAVHPLEDVAAALTSIDERRATGKVVLEIGEGGPAARTR